MGAVRKSVLEQHAKACGTVQDARQLTCAVADKAENTLEKAEAIGAREDVDAESFAKCIEECKVAVKVHAMALRAWRDAVYIMKHTQALRNAAYAATVADDAFLDEADVAVADVESAMVEFDVANAAIEAVLERL
jgi:hypothetical protein